LKEIKIDFKYFWKNFDKENNLFTKLLKENYKVTLSQDPEFVFFSSFKNKNTLKMPSIEGDFVKIFYTGENCRPQMDKCDWAFTFDYDEKVKSPRHLRLPLYTFHGAGEDLIKHNNPNQINSVTKKKTNFCAYVYSKDTKERTEIFTKLSKYKKVNSPGKSMNNQEPLSENKLIQLIGKIERKTLGKNQIGGLLSRHFEDYEKTKVNFLKSHKFTIAFENSSYPGYTTEKIYHPMLANSIPIYWGNPLIEQDFNTKSFINYHDYNDMNKVVDKVIDLDTNEKKYIKMLQEPWYKNNKPSKYVDRTRIVKRLREIFG
jgi:hypothetical protein